MKKYFILLTITFLSTGTAFAQTSSCYELTRSKGIAAYNAGNYDRAIKYFETATICEDLPNNNDLQTWINKCKAAEKQKAENAAQAEKDRLAREEAVRKRKAEEAAQAQREREAELQRQQEAQAQREREAEQRQQLINLFPMVYVAGGTFTMGCTSEQGSDCYSDESPAHQVTLSDFYIGKYEVTQAQWKAVMGRSLRQIVTENGWNFYGEGDNYPMYDVSWDDIVGTAGSTQVINGITYYSNGFIYKLNQMTGKKYRLPTEAEWEYAARGGGSRVYKYSGSNTADNVAWYYENAGDYRKNDSNWTSEEALKNRTHPVGTKQANELGIYDMSGNVWEWCSDWYGAYSSGSQTNPRGASSGSYRVNRGGSWSSFARYVRVSVRNYSTPDHRYYNLGFRLASSSK